jgi:hypothetical protein
VPRRIQTDAADDQTVAVHADIAAEAGTAIAGRDRADLVHAAGLAPMIIVARVAAAEGILTTGRDRARAPRQRDLQGETTSETTTMALIVKVQNATTMTSARVRRAMGDVLWLELLCDAPMNFCVPR